MQISFLAASNDEEERIDEPFDANVDDEKQDGCIFSCFGRENAAHEIRRKIFRIPIEVITDDVDDFIVQDWQFFVIN
jgi:hypothetical protein